MRMTVIEDIGWANDCREIIVRADGISEQIMRDVALEFEKLGGKEAVVVITEDGDSEYKEAYPPITMTREQAALLQDIATELFD